MTREVKSVCVYCGASPGNKPVFMQAAKELAAELHKRGWSMTFGGGSTGMMGACARELVSLGGQVHGIIPKALLERECDGEIPDFKGYGKTTVVGDMHTRKRMMAQLSQAFVALPGGFGTCEEIFEVITWSYLGIHTCPIVIFNVDGFYDSLLQFIRSAVENGFISSQNEHIVVEARSASEVGDAILNYRLSEGRLGLTWDDQTPLTSPSSENGPTTKTVM